MEKKITVLDKTFVPYISAETLQTRIAALGAQITADYQGKCPLFVSVLNGAFMFTSDLFKHIALPAEIMFVRFQSYEGTHSTGKIKTVMGFDELVRDRDVIITEDIIDSGLTIKYLHEEIKVFSPRSVKVAALLHKPEATVYPVEIDYLAFSIENRFVVGYGLDYDGRGRNLPEIYQLEL